MQRTNSDIWRDNVYNETMRSAQRRLEPPPPDLATREAGQALLRTFFSIADAWKLSARESMTLLGLRSRSTYHVWKEGKSGALSRDTLERISYVLGIFKALQM